MTAGDNQGTHPIPTWGDLTSSYKHWVFLALAFAIANLVSMTSGSSWYAPDLALFFLLLAAAFAVASSNIVGRGLESGLDKLALLLMRRGAFFSNAEQEAPKFALLRIAFGLFMIERAFWICAYLTSSDWAQPAIWIFALANLTAALFVAIGLFTQISLAYLVLVQWQIGDWAL